MTKDEMQLYCSKTYDDFEHLFKQIKVDRIAFLEWLESFEKYEDLRKANTFVGGKLTGALINCRDTWRFHSPTAWASLRIAAPSIPELKVLDGKLKILREVWKRRPKSPRRY